MLMDLKKIKMHDYLSGIQQVGIGVKNATEAMLIYKDLFGQDVLIFDDVAEANLMFQYTGDKIYKRRAILTMNLQGGGGFEIWQFLDRKPSENKEISLGDIGIFAPKIKSVNIQNSHKRLKKKIFNYISEIKDDSNFYFQDDFGNNYNIVASTEFFKIDRHDLGGVCGAIIGVSDMEESVNFYKNVLGISEILQDFEFETTDGKKFRKVILYKKATGKGAFNTLLGSVEIELVQLLNGVPNITFKNRFWGDCGFIHLCFDVLNMNELKKHCQKLGHSFTVDSNNTFSMDNASGRFCYIEDPDGTLIELVETHKVPVLKKLNLFLDLRKRDFEKPLPKWMINMLAFSKVK